MNAIYAIEPGLEPAEFIDVLRRSSLAERRPVDDPARIAGMLRHADLILTARNEAGLLIGVARAITDFFYCTYLSDLAVDREFQRRGIGRELIRRTHEAAGLQTTLILLSPPSLTVPSYGDIQHLLLEDVSWDLYEKLLKEVGDRSIRMTYDDGRLEIMSPLPEHEDPKTFIGRMIETLTLESNMPVKSLGSTTFRRKDKAKGLEPDECYYFRDRKRCVAESGWI